jgi:hypothetical protein
VGSLLALVAGCGGGGGGGTPTGGLNVFITDDLSTGYDQIWVTVHQIDLQDSSGGFVNVFSSTDGVPVDLTSLNDGSPRFMFMGKDAIPTGSYTGMRVTMARGLTMVATGSSNGEACTFDPSIDFGASQSRASFAFGAPVALNANSNIVLDFDLPNWTKNGNVVTPAFRRGDDSTLNDPGRHESEDYHGRVANLSGTAPDQTFTLSRTAGSFSVRTDASTLIYNENGAGSPVLINSQRVEVRGRFDVTANQLVATVIKIEDDNDDEDKVVGPTSNLDTGALTVDVSALRVEGFLPSDPIVHVQFSASTRFFTKAGMPLTLNEMLTFLATGIEVEAEGSYTAGTNTLNAAKIKLHPEDGGHHDAEAKGSASNVNAGAGTFDLTLMSWYGFSSSSGTVINVVTNGSTTYRNDNGDPITSAEFFAAIQGGFFAEVEGTFSNGVLTASKAKLEDEGGGGGGGQPEAKGYVVTSNLGNGTVVISLVEWFGFNGSFGAQQTIQTTGSTEFEDDDGNSMTQAAFFAGLSTGKVIDAKGSYSNGVLNATRARYKD